MLAKFNYLLTTILFMWCVGIMKIVSSAVSAVGDFSNHMIDMASILSVNILLCKVNAIYYRTSRKMIKGLDKNDMFISILF